MREALLTLQIPHLNSFSLLPFLPNSLEREREKEREKEETEKERERKRERRERRKRQRKRERRKKDAQGWWSLLLMDGMKSGPRIKRRIHFPYIRRALQGFLQHFLIRVIIRRR